MGELSDVVNAAIPIFLGSHGAATLARAYVRYKLTQEFYPDKGLAERLPRCVARRILSPRTMAYTLTLGTFATMAYYILRNI